MRTSIFIALSLTLATASAPAAENFSCPALKLPSGKQLTAHSISVFDGPPAEMAELVPDNADTNSKDAYYWIFSGQETAVWVVCNYKGSKQTQQFALPKAFKKCQVTGRLNAGSSLSCE
ncbi:MAG: hypothetical protein JWR56_2604 [Massilia sp.]|nr:hypothetical protein [Massilia sp.]